MGIGVIVTDAESLSGFSSIGCGKSTLLHVGAPVRLMWPDTARLP